MRSIPGLAAVAALVALAACSSTPSHPAAPAPRSPSSAPTSAPATKVDPLTLVGRWNWVTVQGKPTTDSLSIDDGLTLSSACGDLIGSWSANADGMFVAQVDGGTGGCVHVKDRRVEGPSWLMDAVRFTPTGNGVSLLDASGRVVAHLVHGHGIYEQPDLTRLRQRLATAPPLAAGQTPVTATTIVGRWEPVQHGGALVSPGQTSPPPSFVTFAADGTWSGSDGCNGQGGRWRIGSGGALVTTAGPSTLIGCAGFPVGSWVSRARRAFIEGGMLTLLDASGQLDAQLGRA